MMKTKILILISFLMLPFMASAEERLTIENFTIDSGETKEVCISMANEAEYVAFQFDVYLPKGLTIESCSAVNSRIPEHTTLTGAVQADGSYRIIAVAMKNEPIKGDSGTIVTITVKASDNLVSKYAKGFFRNVKLSKADATGPKYEEIPFPVTIYGSMPAPVTVTANDYVRFYGDTNPVFEFTSEGEELSGIPEITCEATETSPVGKYPIVIQKGSVTNFNDNYVNGTLTIIKAPLTITAKGYTIKWGDELPVFEAVYDGLKNNETGQEALTSFSISCSATSMSEVGTYDIVVTATSDNYELTLVQGTLTITEPDSHTLLYMVDGEVYQTYSVKYGSAITPESEPTKEGYTFSGWSEIPATMPSQDVTVTGTFTVNKYMLTYMVDGEAYKTFEVEYGSEIIPESVPEKEGYAFSGWSELPATMPSQDITVTGTFNVINYMLTYMVDGETYKTFEVEYGSEIIPESEPTKEGYTFSGWSEIPATMPSQDVTVTGTFTVNNYTLTYMVDGEAYKTFEVEYGSEIIPESEPTKEGYTFSGWSEIPATMPSQDVTVTATFTINRYTLTYMVDGEVYKTCELEYGSEIEPEADPVKEGYTFGGWSEIPETMPANDVTITGSFTINKYTLTYIVDGETYKTYEVEYGAEVTPEIEPTKEGYTFSGWSEIPETMPANDVVVTGTFSLVDAVSGINKDECEYQILTSDGRLINKLQKGLNIIRFSNGSTRKVMVK